MAKSPKTQSKLKGSTQTKPKAKGGNRSNEFDYYTSEHGLAVIIQAKRDGKTNDEVAQQIGISRSTLYAWAQKSSTLSDTLKVSKAQADANLENKAYKMAMEGNTTMMIFLLKNRMSDKYRDRQEIGLDMAKEELKDSVGDLIDKLGA